MLGFPDNKNRLINLSSGEPDMKIFRSLLFALLCASAFALRAQPLITDTPKGENIRLAWLFDHDGDEGSALYGGFEVGYGSVIYPLQQLLVSYSHMSVTGYEYNSVMISIEQYFPISEQIVPYGIAGFGFGWSDLKDDGGSGDKESIVGKIGAGLLLKLCSASAVYAEVTYLLSDEELWQDDDAMDAQNLLFSLGVRLHF